MTTPVQTDLRRILRTAFMAIWIVPESQIYILSLTYQEHLFRLFHKRLLNRISHYIGIPLAAATMYAALPFPFALALAGTITMLHIAIAARHRLWALCGLVLLVQSALALLAVLVLAPFYAGHSALWASPWLHVFGWSFLQYATHALEARVPAPWGRTNMTPRDEWLREANLSHWILVLLALIPHVVVEWISGPRNLFLILLRLMRHAGYNPPALKKIDANLDRIGARREPVLRHNHFQKEIARVDALEGESLIS
jgi:hypothetical protein